MYFSFKSKITKTVHFQGQENSLASSDSSTGNLSSIPKTEVEVIMMNLRTDELQDSMQRQLMKITGCPKKNVQNFGTPCIPVIFLGGGV